MRRTLTEAARSLCFVLLWPAASAAPAFVAVGTYTHGAPHQGIWMAEFDEQSGTLQPLRLAAESPDPSFLAQSADGATLAASEEHGNAVSTFAFNRHTGRLTLLGRQACPGSPAHIALSPDGHALVAANYGGGTVAVFPLEPSGAPGPRAASLVLPGPLGPDPRRQTQSRPHSALFGPDATALICDLGADRISIFRLRDQPPFLGPQPQWVARVLPGSGPRHAVFARDGRHFYVVNEMAATVAVFAWPSHQSEPQLAQTVSLLPPAFSGDHGAAEIALSADERFLYASTRGPDLLTVLGHDAQGRWQVVQILPCGGKVPRSFALDPSGHWLLCAHQKSADLTLFQVDPATGRLTPRAGLAGPAAPAEPACVLWLR